jgi:GNAT superfamily N-acetyltransferase
MTGDFVVREARPDDAEGFVRAHESAWDATIAPIVGKSLEELAPFAVRVELYRTSVERVSDEARVWVAERAGEIVGTAVALRRSPDQVELRDLYVAPTAWGTGVASALMESAIESVRGGAHEALLWVGEANVRARRFYEREGWIADGSSRASQLGPPELRYLRALES